MKYFPQYSLPPLLPYLCWKIRMCSEGEMNKSEFNYTFGNLSFLPTDLQTHTVDPWYCSASFYNPLANKVCVFMENTVLYMSHCPLVLLPQPSVCVFLYIPSSEMYCSLLLNFLSFSDISSPSLFFSFSVKCLDRFPRVGNLLFSTCCPFWDLLTSPIHLSRETIGYSLVCTPINALTCMCICRIVESTEKPYFLLKLPVFYHITPESEKNEWDSTCECVVRDTGRHIVCPLFNVN